MAKETPTLSTSEYGKTLTSERLPPAEPSLREAVLGKIENIQDKDLDEICKLFGSIGVEENPQEIKQALLSAVLCARLSGDWSGGDRLERVEIGYYASEGEYFAKLLHEDGHNILTQFGQRVGSGDWEIEEDFCWRFSNTTCRLLKLPYSAEIEEVCRGFIHLHRHHRNYSRKELNRKRDALIEREKAIRGFSEGNGDKFHFSPEGVPIID